MSELAGRAFLLRELVVRDWRSRYAGSALSFLWAFAQPAAQLLLFTFVFATVLRLPGTGRPGDFATFLFCGLLPWIGINEGLQRSATAFTEGAFLLRKHRFPAALLVVSTVLAAMIQQLAAGAIFLVVILVSRGLAWERLLVWPLLLMIQASLAVGLGLALAVGQVLLRDVAQALGIALTCWFYATPIVYPSSLVPESWHWLLVANPLAALVDAHRWMLLGDAAPSAGDFAVLVPLAVVAPLLGLWLYRRLRPTLSDEI